MLEGTGPQLKLSPALNTTSIPVNVKVGHGGKVLFCGGPRLLWDSHATYGMGRPGVHPSEHRGPQLPAVRGCEFHFLGITPAYVRLMVSENYTIRYFKQSTRVPEEEKNLHKVK